MQKHIIALLIGAGLLMVPASAHLFDDDWFNTASQAQHNIQQSPIGQGHGVFSDDWDPFHATDWHPRTAQHGVFSDDWSPFRGTHPADANHHTWKHTDRHTDAYTTQRHTPHGIHHDRTYHHDHGTVHHSIRTHSDNGHSAIHVQQRQTIRR